MADAFRDEVSIWLSIAPPDLFWFEAASVGEATRAFSGDPSEKENAGADPLRQSCAYFRWSGPRGTSFGGYTHRESPRGVMINVCRLGNDLIETIAHECFHLHQDKVNGEGWRASADTVESEANGFVREKHREIRAFFQDWSNDQSGPQSARH
jgi:hypothetical protein